MERCRRLVDLLVVAVIQLLTHMPHDLSLPRHPFQRLGHILAELREARSTAALAKAEAESPGNKTRGRSAENGWREDFFLKKM